MIFAECDCPNVVHWNCVFVDGYSMISNPHCGMVQRLLKNEEQLRKYIDSVRAKRVLEVLTDERKR